MGVLCFTSSMPLWLFKTVYEKNVFNVFLYIFRMFLGKDIIYITLNQSVPFDICHNPK